MTVESRGRARPDVRRVVPDSPKLLEPLCELLTDAVHDGASVGFLAPLARATAREYWRAVLSSLGEGLCLWIAELDGSVAGSVQLVPCLKENGRHRAEIHKLLVASEHRGRGIASALMAAAESHAAEIGCSLLVLDTLAGTQAELVYRHLGWCRVGEIPEYAATPDGTLHPTVLYYKSLGG